MTRLEQAKRWLDKNTEPNEWIPHAKIPLRYVKALRKARLINYQYKLFWKRKVFKADRDRGFEDDGEALRTTPTDPNERQEPSR
jgi:hypothetical protein